MNRKSLFSTITILLLVLVLVGCGPAIDETQAATSVPGNIEKETDTALLSNEEVTANIVTQLPFDENSLISLYEQVNTAVVNIRVVDQPDESDDGDHQPSMPEFPTIPGFPEFPQFEPAPPQTQQGLGSGFIYDEDGHIITNNHVVVNADRIVVTFADGREAEAALVGTDPDSDLAVIQVDVDGINLTTVPLGKSENLKVGQLVVAIGNPFGLEGSMTTGIISGLGRMLPTGSRAVSGARFSIPDIIQTDAAINPGNSGGPLLNISGEVIGVNTAIESPVRGFAGIGYAVPADTISEVVPQLIVNGHVEHPWLGIAGQTLTADLAQAMNLDETVDGGVLITQISADSPADKAGLHGSNTEIEIDGIPAQIGGDIIIGVDDQPVKAFDDLLSYIVHETEIGQTVRLYVVRDNLEKVEIPVTLTARPVDNE